MCNKNDDKVFVEDNNPVLLIHSILLEWANRNSYRLALQRMQNVQAIETVHRRVIHDIQSMIACTSTTIALLERRLEKAVK